MNMPKSRQIRIEETQNLPKRLGVLRYVIVDAATGNVVDDSRGFGYADAEKARRAWRYKCGIKYSREEQNFLKDNRGPVLGGKNRT